MPLDLCMLATVVDHKLGAERPAVRYRLVFADCSSPYSAHSFPARSVFEVLTNQCHKMDSILCSGVDEQEI